MKISVSLAGGAEHHVDLCGGTGADRVDRSGRQDGGSVRWLERHRRGRRLPEPVGVAGCGELIAQLDLGLEDRGRRTRHQVGEIARLDSQLVEDVARGRRADPVVAGSARRDRAAEQALRRRRGEQCGDAHAPCALSGDRHLRRVPAECGDVLAHPFECSDLVEDADVARVAELDEVVGEVAEALHTEEVVDRHAHHPVACEGRAVVHVFYPAACRERTTVDPDQHGQTDSAGIRGPPVELRQSSPGGLDGVPDLTEDAGHRRLDAHRAISRGVSFTVPRSSRYGWPESAITDRWRSVRKTEEGMNAALVASACETLNGSDHNCHSACTRPAPAPQSTRALSAGADGAP